MVFSALLALYRAGSTAQGGITQPEPESAPGLGFDDANGDARPRGT